MIKIIVFLFTIGCFLIKKNECQCTLTCLNGGSCLMGAYVNGANMTCACPAPYTGSNCQISPVAVATSPSSPTTSTSCSSPCLNGGICVNATYTLNGVSNTIPVCACSNGFSGYNCGTAPSTTTTTTTAASITCQNNGVPIKIGSLTYCACRSGYGGPFCQNAPVVATTAALYTSCTSLACINGGTCIQVTGNPPPAPICACTNGWGGTLCDQIVTAAPQSGTGTAGPANTGTGTAGPANTGTGTAGPANTGTETAGPTNTGTGTAGPANTETGTAGPTNTGTGTAGPTNTGTGTAGPTNTETGTAGPTNTGTGTAGPTNTGTGTAGPTTTASGGTG